MLLPGFSVHDEEQPGDGFRYEVIDRYGAVFSLGICPTREEAWQQAQAALDRLLSGERRPLPF